MMELKDWLWFGFTLGGVFISLIGMYIRLLLKVNNQGMEIIALKKSFHMHEMQNEKTNDKLEKKLDSVDSKLDELKMIIIQDRK
jgi:hypothetical protein